MASLIFLNLPPKTFIGIDLLSFNSSPHFQGISNIPPGLHFLYSGTDASLSIRTGRWLNLSAQETKQRVLQWNTETENLDLLDDDDGADDATVSSSGNRGLVDYAALADATSDLAEKEARESRSADRLGIDQDEDNNEEEDNEDATQSPSAAWSSLSRHISPAALSRILSPSWTVSSISSAPTDTESIPGLSHLEAENVLHQLPLNLLPVDLKQTWSEGDIGRVRTERARDRSWYLSSLIDSASPGAKDKTVGARQVLGEVQFCFLMVLTLANYSCLEQWKRLLTVFFTSRNALTEVEGYFVQMVKVLAEQMRHVDDLDGGMFELRDEAGSAWLRSMWAKFRASVEDEFEESEATELKTAVQGLQSFFEGKYGWLNKQNTLRRGMLELEDGERIEVSMDGVDEDEETGEYAPVVVDT